VEAVKAALWEIAASAKAAARQPAPFRPTLRQRANELRFRVRQGIRDLTGPRKYLYDSQGRPNMTTPYLKPVEQYWERPPLYWKEKERIPRAGLETDSQLGSWENNWARTNAGRRWYGPPPPTWRG
jgi:hypothetical protein